jgi:CRP-like cAMP-binding protein
MSGQEAAMASSVFSNIERSGVSNPLIGKLQATRLLLPADLAELEGALTATCSIPAHQDLARIDDLPRNVHVLTEGFACRYKVLPDGRRAIVAFLLPGDFCDLHSAVLGRTDHAVASITACIFARTSFARINELAANNPRIANALWRATLADEAISREWLASMGQRSAGPQLAHLICELFFRLQMIDLAGADSFPFPFTQEELGDALGLSSVHVNRVLHQLRDEGLISLQGRTLTILDLPRLERFAGFSRNYLRSPPAPESIPITHGIK